MQVQYAYKPIHVYIQDRSKERAEFENQFIDDIAGLLNIPRRRIEVPYFTPTLLRNSRMAGSRAASRDPTGSLKSDPGTQLSPGIPGAELGVWN
eukprot:1093058-Amorphochlora_amoeboformis.AAC.1